jgi:hypothetical protein
MPASPPPITDVLRERIRHGLAVGALRDGDRLPGTRALAAELGADPRVVSRAYQALAAEGLVTFRPRAGAFVAALPGAGPRGVPSVTWLADVVAAGVLHGVPVPTLADTLRAVTRAKPLAVAAVAGTLDQALGLARELRDDYGLDARGLVAEQVAPTELLPRAVRRAQALIGTAYTEARVRQIAERLGRPHLIVELRRDLLDCGWRELLGRTTYVVIADPRFGQLVHAFVGEAGSRGNVRILVAGRDDLSQIPADAPTYVTEAARERLDRARLPWRLVAPTRTICDTSVQTLAAFLVQQNLANAGAPARRARRKRLKA